MVLKICIKSFLFCLLSFVFLLKESVSVENDTIRDVIVYGAATAAGGAAGLLGLNSISESIRLNMPHAMGRTGVPGFLAGEPGEEGWFSGGNGGPAFGIGGAGGPAFLNPWGAGVGGFGLFRNGPNGMACVIL
jgi:hypothetical protein